MLKTERSKVIGERVKHKKNKTLEHMLITRAQRSP